MRNVVVVGCGAIGAPIAVAFAARGLRVVGIDRDSERVRRLNTASLIDNTDGLNAELADGVARGFLVFETQLSSADEARAYLIAVPTPVDAADCYDSAILTTAMREVVAMARDGDLIAIRSTTPIGSLRRFAEAFDPGGRLLWATCPDRSLAGRGLTDQLDVTHVVGGLDAPAGAAAKALFETLGPVVEVSSPEAAEALKLFANVQRDVMFALANQFALVCETAGVDFEEVRVAGAVGFARSTLARAGPVGGPCLSKDVFLLAEGVEAAGTDLSMLHAARRLNAGLADRLADRIIRDLGETGGPGSAVAVLGLAFKGAPPVRDRSHAFGPRLLQALGDRAPALDVRGWDPVSDPAPAARAAAVAGARVVVLANEHPDLANPSVLADAAPGALVYDMCGMLSIPPRADIVLRRFGQGGAS
jgi:UDP-N-acetyl-D-mannosaminuronic acid dehydrogenase